GEYQKGDFILHFAGFSPETKLAGVVQAIASSAEPSCQPSVPVIPAAEAIHELLPLNSRSHGIGKRRGAAPVRPWTDLPPTFCITCWQTPQRTALAARHFRERRLNVQFFPAIHGKTFGLRSTLDPQMQGGQVGVLLAHYMLWQTLAYLPHEEVLILEDDAWFAPNFRSQFRRAYADLPKEWQFVFVGAFPMEVASIEPITDRVGAMCYPSGLHAYLVKRSTLPILLQTNHEARMPIDWQLAENTFPAMK